MDVSILMAADINIVFIVVLFLHIPSPSVANKKFDYKMHVLVATNPRQEHQKGKTIYLYV